MEVPDLRVKLVFVVNRDQVGDQVGDVCLDQVVIITEALGESTDLVLGFVTLPLHFGVVTGALRYPAKGCRSEVDTLEEHRKCVHKFFSCRAGGVDTYCAGCRRGCRGGLWG